MCGRAKMQGTFSLIYLSFFLLVSCDSITVNADLLNGPYGKKTTYYLDEYFPKGSLENLLVSASIYGKVNLMEKSIVDGADVNFIGKDEMTPLLITYGAGQFESFITLLENGANPNFETSRGFSVAKWVAFDFDPDKRKLWFTRLLDHGLLPINYDWKSPYVLFKNSIIYTRLDILEMLLISGGDPSKIDFFPPLVQDIWELEEMANRQSNAYQVIELLLKYDVSIERSPTMVESIRYVLENISDEGKQVYYSLFTENNFEYDFILNG